MIISVKIDTEKPLLEQVQMQLPKPTYIVKKKDVGKGGLAGRVLINSAMENPFEPLGVVLKQDIGKKCVKIKNHWYVENQEQYLKRINRKS